MGCRHAREPTHNADERNDESDRFTGDCTAVVCDVVKFNDIRKLVVMAVIIVMVILFPQLKLRSVM